MNPPIILSPIADRTERDCVPVGSLPEDVVARLHNAESRVMRNRLRKMSAEELYQDASEKAAHAFRSVPPNSTDARLLGNLSDANALATAAASPSCASDFPNRVSIGALLPLANLMGSAGREREAAGQDDLALDRFMHGLKVLQQLRAHRAMTSIPKAAYWLMSRAASAVGRLAAEKQLTLLQMLRDFDSNVELYLPLLGDGDVHAPRAFAAVAQVRHALAASETSDYPERLGAELTHLLGELEPDTSNARTRFRREVDAILAGITAATAETRPPGFRWSAN